MVFLSRVGASVVTDNPTGGSLGLRSSGAGSAYQVTNTTTSDGADTTYANSEISGSSFTGSFAYADVIIATKTKMPNFDTSSPIRSDNRGQRCRCHSRVEISNTIISPWCWE